MSLKIGIVGAGGMLRYHTEGFRSAGASITAIADVNPDACAKAASRFQVPKTYRTLADMVAGEPDLDAVSIIVPNKFHMPVAIEALQAGKHVFCEKPPALNASEVISMASAAQTAGKTLMFDFNNRARPESMAMMQYVRDGTTGPILSAQAKWIRRTGIPGFGGWFTNRALSGGGPLIDLLHMVDLALHFMDYPDPEWVLASTFSDFISDRTRKGPWGIPDNSEGVTDVENAAHSFIRFRSGQVLFVQVSWAEMVKREEVSVTFQGLKAGGLVQRLFGVDGLDETSIDAAELYVQENGVSVNRTLVTTPDPAMGRIRAAANFVNSIEGTEKPLNTPDEAIKLMKLIDATYASAALGKPVEVQ
ncbi:MAG TPA: Gfo/Idh/MocA family oxidoreductase [Opitutales bacterium]|nr:Gfo/Idh/MocA family oxidoreductase [Opitutales bacterium]